MAAHPGIDMMSFTGSTRAGTQVAKAAADTVKRVAQELGGKSANIILDDADFARMREGRRARLLQQQRPVVQRADAHARAAHAARRGRGHREGDGRRRRSSAIRKARGTSLGPVVSEAQFEKIQGLIEKGIDEGAELVAGGPGRPQGLDRGYYVRPTVFANVRNDMTIAREEIFGPVLCIIALRQTRTRRSGSRTTRRTACRATCRPAIRSARCASPRGCAPATCTSTAPAVDFAAPFGGYKQSGNGREWGEFGFEEFLEVKAVMGYRQMTSGAAASVATGAEALVRTLVACGVDTCFTNPGTSEMHFVAALDRVDGMRCVLALFEGVATGAADGYARMTGRPPAPCCTSAPGSPTASPTFTTPTAPSRRSSTSSASMARITGSTIRRCLRHRGARAACTRRG